MGYLPDLDPRILSLALARMVDAIANSFLVVVLPLYIGSQAVALPAFVGSTVSVVGVPVSVSTELLIGIVLSLFGFLNSLGQPFTGALSDRTGRRRAFLLFGLALVAVGSAGYVFLTDYVAVLAMRALQGVGAAFTVPVTVALVNELSPSDERGSNFGLFNTFRLLGFGTGPIVAGVVVAGGPYRLAGELVSGFEAAFLSAVAGAVIAFALIGVLIEDPERAEGTAAEDISIRVRGERGGLDPVFALGVATVVMALSIAIYAPLGNVINERLGQGSFLFSVQFGATVLANVVFQLPLGRLSDRYGRRPFLVAGFVLLIPTTLVQGFLTSSTPMIAARFLQGVAVAAVFAPSLALAGDLAKEGTSGSTLSLLTMGFGLGVAFGTLLSGFLVGFGFAVPFVVATAGGVVGLALVVTQVTEPSPGAPGGAPADD
ncbi:MFS transporter [Halobaculum gomorrense]|uniref:Predicted arabinose efflux permease, MFS family n=1 Tax=Halobaculum gomorrense TaxID=43928 RepID=A0A1M5NWZ4_9EURY|nr:MFS transporter [Halobaculum gomorrense]SHG94096.1 Predicted arabinose efflux permease, MFS family [Halobaculum gomorrense]